MSTRQQPELRLHLDNTSLSIDDACRIHPYVVREKLVRSLLTLPLDKNTVKVMQLGCTFRRALQAERKKTPYRLQSILSACKTKTIDSASLEARFFEYGEAQAVAALGAAGTDDKDIFQELEELGEDDLKLLVQSIRVMEQHPDLRFMTDTAERKPLSITSNNVHFARPRPSRSTKTVGPGRKKINPRTRRLRNRATLSHGAESNSASRSRGDLDEVTRHPSTDNQPRKEDTPVGPLGFNGMLGSFVECEEPPGNNDYRIGLDSIGDISNTLNVDQPSIENYRVDLDEFSVF